MESILDLYQLVLTQTISGEVTQNTFHYVAGEGDASAAKLAEAFIATVLPKINAIQGSTWVVNTLVRVIHLFDLSDFYESALTGTGDTEQGGGNLPTHDAVNYTLRVNTRAIRPGKKRFGGLPMAGQQNGVFTGANYVGRLNTLRVQLGTNLTGSDTIVYQPVVVKRIREVDAGTGAVTYRLPANAGEAVTGAVTTVLLNMNVSHQDTRS